MPDRPLNSAEPLPITSMTWAALLARWTEFARASVAFPKDETGDRWRASVAPLIGLQSVAFALGEVDSLGADERALGLDRASVLVRTNATELHSVWRGEAMPDALREVVDDAHRALTLARTRGVEYRVVVDRIEAPDILGALERSIREGARVDFALAPVPGASLFRAEPALFVRPGVPGLVVEGLEPVPSPPRQIYRQPGTGNEPARDVIALFDDAIQPGAPMLRVVIDDGRFVAPAGILAPSRVGCAEVVEKPLDDDRV